MEENSNRACAPPGVTTVSLVANLGIFQACVEKAEKAAATQGSELSPLGFSAAWLAVILPGEIGSTR